MAPLNHLEFPNPGTEVEQVDEILRIDQGLVACLEHVHIAARYVLEDLKAWTTWCLVKHQSSAIPNPIAKQRHGVVRQACDHDVPFLAGPDRLLLIVEYFDEIPPRCDAQTFLPWNLKGDVTHLA